MSTRSLRIRCDITDGLNVSLGPREWWSVRIYDDVEQLREAAHRQRPELGREHWADTEGVCQQVGWLFQVDDDGNANPVPPKHGLCGVIRLARPFTYEQAIHEVTHAALFTYRAFIKRDARLGVDVGEREEQLAYIVGQLADDLIAQL